MRKSTLTLLALVIAALPLGYLALLWPSVPQTVPMHFNFKLEPDRFGSRNELWAASGILSAVGFGCFLALTNLKRFDPKRQQNTGGKNFRNMAMTVVIFLSVLGCIVVTASAKGGFILKNFLLPVLGVFLSMIGNYMHSIKPNYVAGFRLPWTLSDDDNWRKTHRLGGKLWVAAGVIITAVGLLLPPQTALWILIASIAIASVVPSVYSYNLFRTKSRNASSTL